MDLGLPGKSGIDTITDIRNLEGDKKSTIIIVLTGYNDALLSDKCLAIGANAVANKPITKHQLKQLIANTYIKSMSV